MATRRASLIASTNALELELAVETRSGKQLWRVAGSILTALAVAKAIGVKKDGKAEAAPAPPSSFKLA
eukprot:2609272-Prymnesium_polylepis.1